MDAAHARNYQQQPVVRPISSKNIVENGALIVVAGKSRSGKTCVIENAIFYCLDSFLTEKFAPLYIAEDAEFGEKYFGHLFASCLQQNLDTMRQTEIWQLGYQNELQTLQFQRQGALYLAAHSSSSSSVVIQQPLQKTRPRLLFYFDKCNSVHQLNYVAKCLAKTPSHRRAHSITLIETESTTELGEISTPEIMIFTSRFEVSPTQTAFFRQLLQCDQLFAQDLIETANSFIDSCHVALVINVHQWFETEKRRGIFIYEYSLVPPLDEQLTLRRHKIKKTQHRHRRRHRKPSQHK